VWAVTLHRMVIVSHLHRISMTFWKKVVCLYAISYMTTRLIFHFWKSFAIDYEKFHVYRLGQIFDINFAMLPGSVFLWARLRLLFLPSASQLDSTRSNSSHTNASAKSNHVKTIFFQCLYCTFAAMAHIAHLTFYFYSGEEPGIISFACLFFFGVWIHLVIILTVFSILNFTVRLCQASKLGREALKPCLRVNMVKTLVSNARWQTMVAFGTTLILSLLLLHGAYDVQVKSVEIHLKRLPLTFDGFKIVLLTDLHAGPVVGRSAFSKIVNLTNSLDAGRIPRYISTSKLVRISFKI